MKIFGISTKNNPYFFRRTLAAMVWGSNQPAELDRFAGKLMKSEFRRIVELPLTMIKTDEPLNFTDPRLAMLQTAAIKAETVHVHWDDISRRLKYYYTMNQGG